MIFPFFKKPNNHNLLTSKLFSEEDFYKHFLKDLYSCKKEVLIESPYITSNRLDMLKPIFQALLNKGIKIHIITRDPIEHDEVIRHQATNEILYCKEIGINVILLTGFHHRKLAIIDNNVLWEGSLNILSQSRSKEIMRRISGNQAVREMREFLRLDKIV